MKKYLVLFVVLISFGCKKEKSDIVPFEIISLNEKDKMSVYNYNGYLQISITFQLNPDNHDLILKKYSELITSVKDKWKISLISFETLNGPINADFVNKIRAINKKFFLSNGLRHKYDYDSDILYIEFAKPSLPHANGEDTVDK
jgi:hypothetical protein